MKQFLAFVASALALATCTATPAFAQTASSVQYPAGWAPGTALCVRQTDGTCTTVSTTNPLPVTGGTGGGGGGGGDASAANQSTQITAEQAIQAQIGAVSSPATGSVNQRLGLINTALGSPFQAGGSIGNTSFGISGTLPAFAATPTFNLGTLNGAATSAKQDSLLTALGSPLQAGGSIGNTSFGISGSLPAGTNNIGTVNTVVQATATDRGGTFGTTATQLMASNASRRGFSVQVQGVPDTNGSTGCWISGQATATADYHSLYIGRGTYFETAPTHVGTGAVSIICSAASMSVYAREY